jgi:hypothetical protein
MQLTSDPAWLPVRSECCYIHEEHGWGDWSAEVDGERFMFLQPSTEEEFEQGKEAYLKQKAEYEAAIERLKQKQGSE